MGRRSNRRNEANVGENHRCESAAENGEGNGSEGQQGSQQGPHNGDVVLKTYLHCEACAKKIVKCLMHFDGVEDVNTDCKNHTVTVKGTNVDPRNVAERIEKKCNKQVVILSPKLKEKNPTNKVEKTEANKKEPKVISVVLKLYIHCENCGENTKQSVQKMKGVKRVEVDLKNSQITVKGEFEPEKLVEFMDKKEGQLTVGEFRQGHAGAFGDDIAIDCIATKIKIDVYQGLRSCCRAIPSTSLRSFDLTSHQFGSLQVVISISVICYW
ncbi:hypothetical protein Nepgr_029257 [Nepenthes gracilis]|uniref:HMA domain-containing protein n=1 Tax=Nepenthes gracilis TaxID=150966 RepID=A0AAD3TDQ9_NEPGR|nr:hypothetical protein Nepgr_029257 [Nepenthes gracilis]